VCTHILVKRKRCLFVGEKTSYDKMTHRAAPFAPAINPFTGASVASLPDMIKTPFSPSAPFGPGKDGGAALGIPTAATTRSSATIGGGRGPAQMTTLDAIERLIGEADIKFAERARAVLAAARAGESVHLHLDRTGAGGLRQQVAHLQTLLADTRFLEMLSEVEKCLAPEYALRGTGDLIDRSLRALLAGILKALLREAAALPSYAARKVLIEMAYNWYVDKAREILDVQLARVPLPSLADVSGGATGSSTARGIPIGIPNGVPGSAAATMLRSAVAAASAATSQLNPAAASAVLNHISMSTRSIHQPHAQTGGSVPSALFGSPHATTASGVPTSEIGASSFQPLLAANNGATQDSIGTDAAGRAKRAEGESAAVAAKLQSYMQHDLVSGIAARQTVAKAQETIGGGSGVGLQIRGAGYGLATSQRGASFAASTGATGHMPNVVMRRGVSEGRLAQQQAASSARTGVSMYGGVLPGGANSGAVTTYVGAASATAPAGVSPFLHTAQGAAPRGHTDAKSRALPATLEAALAASHQRVVSHAAKKLEAAFEDRELRDVNATLQHNRARLMEEVARRLESREYGAQTGRAAQGCMLRRVPDPMRPGTLVPAHAVVPSAQTRDGVSVSSSGDAGWAANLRSNGSTKRRPLGARNGSGPVGVPGTGVSTTDLGPSPDGPCTAALNALGIVVYDGPSVSLSAYDHPQLTPAQESTLREAATMVRHANEPIAAAAATSGVKAEAITGPPLAAQFDLRVAQPAGVAGSTVPLTSSGAGTAKRAPPIPSLPLKSAAARRPASAKQMRPTTSGLGGGRSPGAAGATPGSLTARGPARKGEEASVAAGPVAQTHYHPVRDIFPHLFQLDADTVRLQPSVRRLEQLQLVADVRDAFARAGGGVVAPSIEALESALVSPDDLPHDMCARLLPRPGAEFVRNPYAPPVKAAAGAVASTPVASARGTRR
jgi:hypothetical protein